MFGNGQNDNVVVLLAVAAIGIFVFAMIRRLSEKRAQRAKEEKAKAEKERLLAEKQALFEKASEQLQEKAEWIKFLSSELRYWDGEEYGYLAHTAWNKWCEFIKPIYGIYQQCPVDMRAALPFAETLAEICEIYAMGEKSLQERNRAYLEYERTTYARLFRDVGGPGKNLDPSQIEAAITDDDNTLVVAGAGSGKTLTVVGKIRYMVERWKVDPSEILAISFTRKSVGELQERIQRAGIEGVTVKTFHSIGVSVLGDKGVCNENDLHRCIHNYLKNEIVKHPEQLLAFLDFYGCKGASPSPHDGDAEQPVKVSALKAYDMQTLKGKLDSLGTLDTWQGEKVKSLEELAIANFLFLHGVKYEYEKNYSCEIPEELRDPSKKLYQPDFYLSDYDIWLEHFGVNKEGRAPWNETEFEEQQYIEKMHWARRVHAACGTKLLESYSYWYHDQDLTNQLERMLRECGVVMESDPERLSKMYIGLMEADDGHEFASVEKLIGTFISLAKANAISNGDIWDKAREAYRSDGGSWLRFQGFMSFAEPIINAYQASLDEKNQIDYDDMINMAAKRVREEGYPYGCRCIIVDEYQDTSMSRFELVKAIRDVTGARLYCVGDDWQSIYRFTGCDVTLFTHFGKFAGPSTVVRLGNTYRNSKELVQIAAGFVTKNKCQLPKQVAATKTVSDPVTTICTSKDFSAFDAFDYALSEIVGIEGDEASKRSVLVLGRNNFDLRCIYEHFDKNGKEYRMPYEHGELGDLVLTKDKSNGDWIMKPPFVSPEIRFCTVHRAKGLDEYLMA